jgi:hypothetical protein
MKKWIAGAARSVDLSKESEPVEFKLLYKVFLNKMKSTMAIPRMYVLNLLYTSISWIR